MGATNTSRVNFDGKASWAEATPVWVVRALVFISIVVGLLTSISSVAAQDGNGGEVELTARAGYDGYYDIELMGEDTESVEYHELLAHSQAAFTDLFTS